MTSTEPPLSTPSPSLPHSASSATTIATSSPSPPNPPLPPPPTISWPSDGVLTIDWIHGLMDSFDWYSRHRSPTQLPEVFPVNVLDSLILLASKILHKEPNCVHINPAESVSSVIIVGDIHGQLHDLLFLLKDAGYPNGDRVYIFNGDYVDRGAWGLETFFILLAWKILFPLNVYMLRGNHESKYCTSAYGFEKEVLTKYGADGKHVYRKCLGCFEGLPLVTILAGVVYNAHGGLFRSMIFGKRRLKRSKGKKNRKINISGALCLGSFEELSTARRTVLDPPWEGSNLIPGDVLWSDPSMKPGLSPNSERGIGLLWGPDCTEEFLKNNNLKLIIRSHEGPDARDKRDGFAGMDEGYTIDHVVESGKLITVFSAPDYPQFQATEERFNNKGAYIILKSPSFDNPEFRTFTAAPRPEGRPYYDYKDVIDSDEELDLASMVTS